MRNILEEELIMAGGWTRDGGVQDQIDASKKEKTTGSGLHS